MLAHFVIIPAADDARARILARAAQDPATLHLHDDDAGGGGDLLMFCTTPELAGVQRAVFERGLPITRAFGTMQFPAGHRVIIRVNQECLESSQKRMAPLLKWILEELGPCEVFDEDLAADVTARVSQRPEWLFE